MHIILASGSPRRKELLTLMGIEDFSVISSDFDEHSVRADTPQELVQLLALGKGTSVAGRVSEEDLIIAADTIVTIDGQVLGKPKDAEDARRMLRMLSGRTHQVYTGCALLRGTRKVTFTEGTDVTFRRLTEHEIDCYIRSGESVDKAGAYGIQGVGSQLICGINGDYFNVVGLPVSALSRALLSFDIDTLALCAGKKD